MTLKEWRFQKGWTQSDMSEKCGIQVSLLSKYESGIAKPGVKNYKRLNKAGVPKSILHEMVFGVMGNAESVSDNNGDG